MTIQTRPFGSTGHASSEVIFGGAALWRESQATADLFGDRVPVSTLKSYTGHTLGACGALEAWVAIEMMRQSWFHPNANLETPDPECGALDYLTGAGREFSCEYVMSNNFAFGGINTSLIFRRWP